MDFTEDNEVAASGITDGGFQDLPLAPGDVVTLRRNGPNAYGYSNLLLSELKLYEAANLLKEHQGKIQITSDTSKSVSSFEPINLLQNLQNRSCGGRKQSGIISPYSRSNGSADFLV